MAEPDPGVTVGLVKPFAAPGCVEAFRSCVAGCSYAAVQINIGGSADCGGPVTTAGDVDQITVPVGCYDVKSTFVFLS